MERVTDRELRFLAWALAGALILNVVIAVYVSAQGVFVFPANVVGSLLCVFGLWLVRRRRRQLRTERKRFQEGDNGDRANP